MQNVKRQQRLAGVLMPVASLPSADGIGSFGKKAREFVELLHEAGVGIWQILPLNPLSYGNSPYQPFSSFAGDELYIDLELLERDGLIAKEREPYRAAAPGKIDYDAVRRYKEPILRSAYEEFKKREKPADYIEFTEQKWVYPYGVFITLKKQNGMRCWIEWPKEQQDWILDKKYDISPLEDEIGYHIFLQYMFAAQWRSLKEYANHRGVRIMGDMPFYVGIDSLDVWGDRGSFLLDEDGRPTFVAGVPPDYFSATGQRWGNPIYNWERLESEDFRFWTERIRYSAKLYDIVRIDHFRAFDTYWRIPADKETAVEGVWLEAPGYKLFDRLYDEMPDLWIIAEDLGDLRPEVLALRDHFDLLGMFVAQFDLPDKAPTDRHVAYTGTHDNDTAKGWLDGLNKHDHGVVRRALRKYGGSHESDVQHMIRFVFDSEAPIAITPVVDILGLGTGARLNLPGTVGSPNWEWQLTGLNALKKAMPWFADVVRATGRKEKR